MFQIYAMARFINPEAFEDPIPLDSYQSTDPPQIIIRQIGNYMIDIFDLVSHTAFSFEIADQPKILKRFHELSGAYSVVHFYEPGPCETEPYTCALDTLMTVSTDAKCYKEFVKNGASM